MFVSRCSGSDPIWRRLVIGQCLAPGLSSFSLVAGQLAGEKLGGAHGLLLPLLEVLLDEERRELVGHRRPRCGGSLAV